MLLYYLILIIVCLITIFFLYDWFRRDSRLIRQIPGYKSWPVFGNTLYFIGSPENTFLRLRQQCRDFGAFIQINAMNVRFIHLSDPEDLEKLISSAEYITKSDVYQFAAPWLGDGLILSSGKKWHQRRKLLTKSFHFNILKKYFVTFERETEHFVKKVDEETTKEQTDLLVFVGPAAIRIISGTAMGISLGEDEVSLKKYINSIQLVGECFVTRMSRIWLHNDICFNFSSIGKIQKRALSILHTFTRKVIDNKRELLKHANSKQGDTNFTSDSRRNQKMALLDLLLENEKSGFIDDEGIREEVENFMFAGYDTTTITISFFLMAIANEPAVQNKIYEELQRVLQDTTRLPTMEELNELKYLECCIKESLRLYPSVPFIGRKLLKEIVIRGYTIPANTNVLFMIYDLHRCGDVFPDPERFDPDRFLPENSPKRHVYAYIPFSAGPRNCIGQKFAMLEIKLLMSVLLRKFRVDPVTKPSDLVFRADMVLRTKDPIYVRFRLRN